MITSRYILVQLKSRRLDYRYMVYDVMRGNRSLKFYEVSNISDEYLRCDIRTHEFRGRRLFLNCEFKAGENELYTIIAEGNSFEELRLQIPWLFL